MFPFHVIQILNRLQLDDNQITFIDRRAFMNLNQLQYLTLRGNKLEIVSDEAFQVSKIHVLHFILFFYSFETNI